MNFRRVLVELNRMTKALGNGGTAKEFADHCSVRVSVSDARVYLLRLYKMNLATRKKDRSVGATNHPYRYKVSKKGRSYLRYLRDGYSLREKESVRAMIRLVANRKFDEAIKLYEEREDSFFHRELKDVARKHYREAMERLVEKLEREIRP